MSDFKQSAAKMAERLRIMAKYQKQARDEGREFIDMPVEDLFNAGDQAALDLYDRELEAFTGQQRLPLDLAI